MTKEERSALLGGDERIISFAIGTPEDPMNWTALPKNATDEEKQERAGKNSRLKIEFEKELNELQHRFKDVGDFYFIVNPSLKDAQYLFKSYRQKSFVFAVKDESSGMLTYQFWKKERSWDDFEVALESKDVTTQSDAEDFFARISRFKISFEVLNEAIRELREFLEECSKNGTYYECLKIQVYHQSPRVFERVLNRALLYETPERKKEREKKLRKAELRARNWDSTLIGRDHEIVSFAIATPKDPKGRELTPEESVKLRKDFEKSLDRKYYKYKVIKEKLRAGKEDLYFIINTNIDEITAFFSSYRVDSFVFAIKNKGFFTMNYQYWKRELNGEYVKKQDFYEVERESEVESFLTSIPDPIFYADIESLQETAEDMHERIKGGVYKKEGLSYYERLEKQVFGDSAEPLIRILERKHMYETQAEGERREYIAGHQEFIDRGDYIELVKPVVFSDSTIHAIEKYGSPVKVSIGEGFEYADKLNVEKMGGFSDWRVPSHDELRYLKSIQDKCGINFKGDRYMSSKFAFMHGQITAVLGDPEKCHESRLKRSGYYVICVR